MTIEGETLTLHNIQIGRGRRNRRKIDWEVTAGRFPPGTLGRIDAVLGPSELQADFVREAVERELRRREDRALPADARGIS